MLEKEYIKQLLAESEYEKINEYLYTVYSKILDEYILKNEKCPYKGTLISKASLISKKYPKHSNLMDALLEIVLDEEKVLIDRLNEMVDFYKILINELK